MKNKKYTIIFGIALAWAMLFSACNDIVVPPEISIPPTPVENGYGRISISFAEEEAAQPDTEPQFAARNAARTVFPLTAFDKYEYTFTKAGETTGTPIHHDNDGFFTLEIGSYTVAVQAFTGDGDEEPYTLAASGTSEQFSVNPGDNDPIEVFLSVVTTAEKGKFTYTVNLPENATAEIALKKWSDMSDIALDPKNVTEGNGITETLELDADYYLFTILVSKDALYAGISEVVHIYPAIITEYTKDFDDNDLLAMVPPTSNDYTISGTGTFIYDGNARTASVTRKENASPGAITILYNGTTDEPVNVGTYTVTLNVAAAPGFSEATGLPAGNIIIDLPTPAASDYTISGTGTFTYDGTERVATITSKGDAPSDVTVLYNGLAPLPKNAGTYTVTFNVAATTDWNEANGLSAGTIIINKAGGETVNVPTGISSTSSSPYIYINANAVTAPSNNEQTVEYAISTTTTVPADGWKDSTMFINLNASTTYYVFARAKESTNYTTGTASRSSAITTIHTYTVTANGSLGSKTTALTLTFSGNPGTIGASDITLSSGASIGSATVSGNGNTRTLSPITLTGSGIYNATVSISVSGVETGSKTVRVYSTIIAGLYVKAPILEDYSSVDLSLTSGSTIIDKAFNYINANSGTYTLILDSDISVAPHSSADVSNGTAIRHLKAANAKLTIIGLDDDRKISAASEGGILAAGRTGQTGIELTIGNNIALAGNSGPSYGSNVVVTVQDSTAFTMRDNATVTDTGSRAVSVSNSVTFTMQDNAKVAGNLVSSGSSTFTMQNYASVTKEVSSTDSSFTMSDNASVTGQVSVASSTFTMQNSASAVGGVDVKSNNIFTMKDNASVTGGVSLTSYSSTNNKFTMQDDTMVTGNVSTPYNTFTMIMSGNASVIGSVSTGSSGNFTMSGNAAVSNSNGDGVSVGSLSTFTMEGSSTVSGHRRGVNLSPRSNFTMQDYAKIFNNATTNDGGGVYVSAGESYLSGYGAKFTMKGNASVYGNTAGNGGGVFLPNSNSSSPPSFIMEGNASVSGNTSTASGGGGGVYVGNYGTFEMKGGTISGNKATNAASNGGGVYVGSNSTFTMSGGRIYGLNDPTLSNAAGSGVALYVANNGAAIYSGGTTITAPGSGVDTTVSTGAAGTVTVTYNINGGSGTTPASQTVSAGSSITLPSGSGFSRTGYTFGGWNIDASGRAANYNAGSSYPVIGSITLYAKWDVILTANIWKDGTIPSSGEREQWFRFTATDSTQYIHIDFGTLTDLYVQLYNSDYTTVGSQTRLRSSSGNPYTSQTTLTSGQVYYVRVTPYSSSVSGTYQIAFNTSATAP